MVCIPWGTDRRVLHHAEVDPMGYHHVLRAVPLALLILITGFPTSASGTEPEIVVVGETPPGIAAAVTAARQG
jgi:hypothetical protein